MTTIHSEVTPLAPHASHAYGERTLLSPGWTWAGIAGGAVAGLAVGILMATLGAAIGLTAGAGVDARTLGVEDAKDAAVGFGIGAGVWLIVTAAVVGLVGGGVLSRLLGRERPMHWASLGLVTWATGMFLAALLVAPGAGGAAGGLGGSAAALTGARTRTADGELATPRNDPRAAAPMTETERIRSVELDRTRAAEHAEQATKAAATAGWFALIAQLVGLGATLLMVGKGRHVTGVSTAPRPL